MNNQTSLSRCSFSDYQFSATHNWCRGNRLGVIGGLDAVGLTNSMVGRVGATDLSKTGIYDNVCLEYHISIIGDQSMYPSSIGVVKYGSISDIGDFNREYTNIYIDPKSRGIRG